MNTIANDNAIAVEGAKKLNDCYKELALALSGKPLSLEEELVERRRSRVIGKLIESDDPYEHARARYVLDYVQRSSPEERRAEWKISDAIRDGRLPCYCIINGEPRQVDRDELVEANTQWFDTVQSGKLHCNSDEGSPLEGRRLYIASDGWHAFISDVKGNSGQKIRQDHIGQKGLEPFTHSLKGYALSDAPLHDEMRNLISERKANSPWDAAGQVAHKARGSDANKQRRLAAGFKKRFGS